MMKKYSYTKIWNWLTFLRYANAFGALFQYIVDARRSFSAEVFQITKNKSPKKNKLI